jgi:hypothetical protein
MHMGSFGSCNNGFRPDLATVQTSKTLWISNSNLLLHGTICCNSRKFSGNIRGQNISATKKGLYMPKLALLHQRLQEKKREKLLFGES